MWPCGTTWMEVWILCGHAEPHQQHSRSVQPCMSDAAEQDEDFVLSIHLLLQFCLAIIFHSAVSNRFQHLNIITITGIIYQLFIINQYLLYNLLDGSRPQWKCSRYIQQITTLPVLQCNLILRLKKYICKLYSHFDILVCNYNINNGWTTIISDNRL